MTRQEYLCWLRPNWAANAITLTSPVSRTTEDPTFTEGMFPLQIQQATFSSSALHEYACSERAMGHTATFMVNTGGGPRAGRSSGGT